jgi:hypothetical protein
MKTLSELIHEGEHGQQDFKFRIDDQKKIARTLSAFANCYGGKLIIGVKDNGKIVGCNPEEEFHMIDAAASLIVQPPIIFHSTVWQEDHKMVLIVDILPSNRKHKAPDEENSYKYYIRVGDKTLVANKITVGVWRNKLRESVKPIIFDEKESTLLKYIEKHQPTSLSQLYRNLNLPKTFIDKMLIQFICWELVVAEYDYNLVKYKLFQV